MSKSRSILVFSLALTASVIAQPVTQLGDINADGQVDTNDLAAMIGVLSGEALDTRTRTRADLNADGKVDHHDLTLLVEFFASDRGRTICGNRYPCCSMPIPIGCCSALEFKKCSASSGPGGPGGLGGMEPGEIGGGGPGEPGGPTPADPCEFILCVRDEQGGYIPVTNPLQGVSDLTVYAVKNPASPIPVLVPARWYLLDDVGTLLEEPAGASTSYTVPIDLTSGKGVFQLGSKCTDNPPTDRGVISVVLYDIKPKAITFGGGNHVIYPDNENDPAPYNAAYDSDQWYDHDGNGATDDAIQNPVDHEGYTIDRRLPVAYTRNTPMTIAEFEPWVDAGEAITGGPNPGPTGFMYRATHDRGGPNETVFEGDYPNAAPAVGSAALPNHIDYNPLYMLDWEVSFTGGAVWFPIGSTDHEVYVTLNSPDPATLMAESVFRIGCDSAAGADDSMSAWIGIIGDFADLDVHTARRHIRMGYYANGENDNTQVTRASDLLLDPYNGQCGAWSELLVHCLWLHGLDPYIINVLADPDELPDHCGIFDVPIFMLINKYWFGGVATSGCTLWPYRIDIPTLSSDEWPATTTECMATFGAPGQDSPNPPSAFRLHYIVRFEPSPGLQLYFDPSYGNGPFLNEDDWQLTSIAGFARRIVTTTMPGREPVGARPSIGFGGIKFVE